MDYWETFESNSNTDPEWNSGLRYWLYSLALGITLSVIVCSRGIFVHYLLLYAPLDRLVNVHILIEQAVLFVTYTTYFGAVLTSHILSVSLETIFGTQGCNIFIALGGPPYKLFMGCGLAVLRFLFLNRSIIVTRFLDKFQMLWIILGLELTLSAISVTLITFAKSLSKFSLAEEFCLGQSREMSLALFSYQDGTLESLQRGQMLLGLSLSLIIFVTSIECIMYKKLMAGLNQHDKAMLKQGVINKTAFNARHKTNVITLAGQEISFAVTVVCILATTISTASIFNGSYRLLILMRSIGAMVVSVCELLTSNDMRRHLKIQLSFS